MSGLASRHYRFGRFHLLPEQRELLIDGEPTKLRGRAFDLLQALVERRGRTVSRSELFDLVWPGRVVEDQNLQVQMVALRKLLGASAITTIPGRGYRFALPLHEEAPEALAEPAQPASTTARPSAATNLPAELPPLSGRTQDIVAVLQLMSQHRLVTLVGPGGIGKTRLALAAAKQLRSAYSDGVWIVELAPLADGALLPAALARVLGLTIQGERTTTEGLARSLAALSMLIVLDNCEHLADAAAALSAALLQHAPRVALLATSQAPLRLSGEQVFRLDPLAWPEADTAADAIGYGAVHLFVARTRALDARFALTDENVAAVIDICRRLDGIPLALELAAARVPSLGLDGVRARLDERLRLLTANRRDAPARHRALRSTLEWSHALLSSPERRLFRRLAPFAGDFSLEAAQQVASDPSLDDWAVLDHLGALVDKSLVNVLEGGAPRYRLLETTRVFAAEQLADAGEATTVRRRHAEATLHEVQRISLRWLDMPTFEWQALAQREVDNLRSAFAFAAGPEGDATLRIALAGSGVSIWLAAGSPREAVLAVDAVAAEVEDTAGIAPAIIARYWHSIGQLGTAMHVAPARGMEAVERALQLHRRLDDPISVYWALTYYVALAQWTPGALDPDAAVAEMRSLVATDWPVLRLRPLRFTVALQHMLRGNWGECRDAFRAEVAIGLQCGDLRSVLLAGANLAHALLVLDEVEAAIEAAHSIVEQARAAGRVRQAWGALGMLALGHILRGDLAGAEQYIGELVPMLVADGTMRWGVDYWPALLLLRGDEENAARLHGLSIATQTRAGHARLTLQQKLFERVREQLLARHDEAWLAARLSEGAGWAEAEALRLIGSAIPWAPPPSP